MDKDNLNQKIADNIKPLNEAPTKLKHERTTPLPNPLVEALRSKNPLADNNSQLTTFLSAPSGSPADTAFTNDTNAGYNHRVDHPVDYWYIISRITVGYIKVYIGQGKAARIFKMDQMIYRLPFPNTEITVETVGATGWYEVIAVKNLDGFAIEEL